MKFFERITNFFKNCFNGLCKSLAPKRMYRHSSWKKDSKAVKDSLKEGQRAANDVKATCKDIEKAAYRSANKLADASEYLDQALDIFSHFSL